MRLYYTTFKFTKLRKLTITGIEMIGSNGNSYLANESVN